MAPVVSRVLLAALFGVGVQVLQVFSRTSGLFPLMEAQQSRGFLDNSQSIDFNFTGVKPLDDVAGFVLMFFWPIVSGGYPGLSLVSFAFAFQAVSVWMVTMIEGSRTGNKSKPISFVSVFGMASQLLGMGMCAPLYLLVHGLTSPLSTTPTISTLSVPSISSIAAVPASVVLSFIAPIIPMCMPTMPLNTRLQSHNVWQIFPVTCSVTHFILSTIWPYNPKATPQNTIKYLRHVYKAALCLAVPAHIGATSISLSAYLFPGLFSSTVVGQLQPNNVFLPPLGAFTGAKVSSIAEGALWFIQWDYLLASSAYLIWAVDLKRAASVFAGDKNGVGFGKVLKLIVRVVVLGPAGAAVSYVWERDEVVFAGGAALDVKKVQ